MTPNESNIIRFMERKGVPVSTTALVGQFGVSCAVALSSLKRHLLVEQDRQHYRLTRTAQDELTRFDDGFKYTPFEGKEGW
mgnify:CR=1 FL=1